MRTSLTARLACAALIAFGAAGCDGGGATPPPGTAATAATVAAPSTTTGPPRDVTLADAEQCPRTLPGNELPPDAPPAGFFGAEASFGNGTLWVGGLWPDGIIDAGPQFVDPDGSVSMKFGWWRAADGTLLITGRRLDAPAPPARGLAPDGYGTRGFQASGVNFPTEGCWEITGDIGVSKLTFVTFVHKKSA